ncbi:hypothetical protein BD413DRAFT_84012 [Trametes elegans]|nr:hypothetical protein BD413DRAFT_84012 [Trametes elegans]
MIRTLPLPLPLPPAHRARDEPELDLSWVQYVDLSGQGTSSTRPITVSGSPARIWPVRPSSVVFNGKSCSRSAPTISHELGSQHVVSTLPTDLVQVTTRKITARTRAVPACEFAPEPPASALTCLLSTTARRSPPWAVCDFLRGATGLSNSAHSCQRSLSRRA